MIRTRAHELLDDITYSSSLTMDGFYQLLRQAGYSEETAQKALSQRSWNRLLAGEVM